MQWQDFIPCFIVPDETTFRNAQSAPLVTSSQLRQIMPKMVDSDNWAIVLNATLPKYGITTKLRLSSFIAQCAHESAQFNILSENLNYSAAALRSVFARHFQSDTLASDYARQPEKIANRVYSNRMGNGPESSGDGWAYRGRGVIQLTGRDNYERFANSIGNDKVVTSPDIVSTDKSLALASACWFWSVNNLNTICDNGDFKLLTRRINGGLNGLEDREKYYNTALQVL